MHHAIVMSCAPNHVLIVSSSPQLAETWSSTTLQAPVGDPAVSAEDFDGIVVVRLDPLAFIARSDPQVLDEDVVRGDDQARVLEADSIARRSLPGEGEKWLRDDDLPVECDGAADP